MKRISIAIIVAMLSLSFSSCKKNNDNEYRLDGLYLTESWDWDGIHQTCKALNFINENTVLVYNTVINYEHWENEYAGNYSVYLGTGFWYYQEGCGVSANYYVIGNKVYIPEEGMIFTIEGNALYPDGGGIIYTKFAQQEEPVFSMKGKTLKFIHKWNDGFLTDYTEIATFKFTDDVSCNYTISLKKEFDASAFGGGTIVETNEHVFNKTYTCTKDRIDINDGWIVLVKVNGDWQWEGHPEFILQ